MIISCPHCQMKHKLPEDVEGKQVRCPGCKDVFRADHETLAGAVQAGISAPASSGVMASPPAPEAAGPAPTEQSSSVEEYDDRDRDEEVRRRRRVDDDEANEPDEDDPLRQMRDEEDAIVASAKRKARVAGGLMLVTAFFILSNVGVNAILSQLANAQFGPAPGPGNDAAFRAGQIIGLICMAAIFLPMIGCIVWAGACLLTLRSRGIVITGVVINFLLLLILGAGLALNVFVLVQGQIPVPPALIWPTVVMNGISCILILATASFTIFVLVSGDVQEAYLIQAGVAERRRRF
jgi:hypothetical protein